MGLFDDFDIDTFTTALDPITSIVSRTGVKLARPGGDKKKDKGSQYDTSALDALVAQAGMQPPKKRPAVRHSSYGMEPLMQPRQMPKAPAPPDLPEAPKTEQDPDELLANSIARLRFSDPKKSQELLEQYGPDIDPKILASVGIAAPVREDDSVLGRLKAAGSSALGDTMTYLNTPVNAIKGAIKEGGPEGAVKALGGKDYGYLLADAEGAGKSIADALGIDSDNPLLGPLATLGSGTAARFAEDVALDPTTYVSFGASVGAKSALKTLVRQGGEQLAKDIGKGGMKTVEREAVETLLRQGAEKAGARDIEKTVAKQLLDLEKSGKGGVRLHLPFMEGRTVTNFGGRMAPTVGEEISPAAKAVDNMFGGIARRFEVGAKIRQAHGRQTAEDVVGELSAGRGRGAAAAGDRAQELSDMVGETGVTHEDLTGPVRHALDGKLDPIDLPNDAARDAYTRIKSWSDAQDEARVAAGAVPAESVRQNYTPLVATEWGQKRMLKNLDVVAQRLGATRDDASKIIHQGGHLMERHFDDAEAGEAWAVSVMGEAPKGKSYYDHNPATAHMARAAGAERTMALTDSLKELNGDLPDHLMHLAPPLAKAPAGIQAAEKATAKAIQANEKRLAYLQGQLSTPSTQKAGQEVTVSAAATKGTSSELVVDGLKHDPVAELALNQRRMNIEQEIATLKDERDVMRRTHKGAREEWEAAEATRQAPPGMVSVPIDAVGTRMNMVPEIAEEVQRVRAVVTNDETIRSAQKAAEKVNRYWKSMVTVLPVRGVAFQVRNAQGNFLLNFVRGIQNPAVYFRAGDIQHKMRQGGLEALTPAQRAYVDNAKHEAVLDSGFFPTDLAPSFPKAQGVGAPKGNVLKEMGAHHIAGEGKAVRAGHRFNGTIEDNARLAAFIHYSDKGLSPHDAAIEVKKGLFDYGQLTPFEQHLLKPYIAFYTFMRKNLTANAAQLVREPGRYTAQAHAYKAVAGQGEDPGGPLPAFAAGAGMIPFGGGVANVLGGGNPVMVGMDTPLGAAVETAEPMVEGAGLLASMVPGLKGLRPEGGVSETARKFLNVPSGPLVEGARTAVEASTGKSLLTGGNIQPGQEDNKLLETLFPLVGAARRSAKKIQQGQALNLLLGLNSAPLSGNKGPTNALQRTLMGLPEIPEGAPPEVVDKMTRAGDSQRAERYRRLGDAEDAIKALDTKGLPAPTLSDLRAAGLAPKTLRISEKTKPKDAERKTKAHDEEVERITEVVAQLQPMLAKLAADGKLSPVVADLILQAALLKEQRDAEAKRKPAKKSSSY